MQTVPYQKETFVSKTHVMMIGALVETEGPLNLISFDRMKAKHGLVSTDLIELSFSCPNGHATIINLYILEQSRT